MCEREGDYADVAMRASGGLSTLLREDHSDGREPATTAAALRHLPRQDPTATTGAAPRYQQELAGKITVFLRLFECREARYSFWYHDQPIF